LAADYETQDSFFGTESWYRITGSAGNQVANNCNCVKSYKYFCAGRFRGWINGTLPSVEEGEVQRQVLFSFGVYVNCAFARTTTKIRNCDGFFVYQFPSNLVSTYYNHRICSQYKHGKLKDILMFI
jgi:hypothetical protein